MDKDLIRKYKKETGYPALIELTPDNYETVSEYRRAFIIELEGRYPKGTFPTPEYVIWLEEQLKEKMKS